MSAARQAGLTDFTVAQARLMARISPNGSRISDLAERALIAKQTATALVDRLEAAGYVERVPDPSDGRARVVRLSARAEELRPLALAAEEEVYAEWAAHVGRRRMAELRQTLTLLREITDPFQDQ
ncbi:MAG: MarR family transcriptional regulator [Micropruina sp.]|nr:MarR family transcriptional regulator [Micropruina sp.]